MTTPTIPTRKSGLPKWLKRLLWLSLIPVILVAGYYSLIMYYYVYGGTFSPVKLSYSEPCGAGEYRLLLYENDNGAGYYEVVDRSGKVLGKAKFSVSMGVSAHWLDDCVGALVPSDDGMVILEVRRSGPARFEGEVTPR